MDLGFLLPIVAIMISCISFGFSIGLSVGIKQKKDPENE
jgi:hypothetical protein